jgi:AAA family ATP:ADP antiporter
MENDHYFFVLFLFFSFLASFSITMSTYLANLFNSSFSPNRLRQLSPIINVSPVIGVIFGGATVNIVIPLIGFLWLISIVGFCFLIVASLNELYRRAFSSNDARSKQYFEKKQKQGNSLFSVLSYFRNSSMAFTIFAAVIFIVTSLQVVDFQYISTVNATFTDPTDAAQFFSYYNFLASPLVILVTIFAAGPMLARLGVSTSLIIRPLLISLCFLAVIIHKGIVEVTILRFVSDFSAIIFWYIPYSLLYNALPIEMRGAVRNTITGVVRMSMEGIAAITIFGLAHYPALTPWVGLCISFLWLIFQLRSRYVYLNTLVSNLKDSNRYTLFDALESLEEANEPIAFQALSRFLQEQKNQLDTEAMIKAIDVISHLKNTEAIRPLAQLIYHPDFYIRYHAIIALQKLVDQRKSYSVVLYFLLHEMKKAFYKDPSGLVRIEAGRFLLQYTPEHKILDFINDILENQDIYGRVLCIQTISKLNSPFMDLLIRLYLDDPHPLVRAESIIALWPFKEYEFTVNQQLSRLFEASEEEIIHGLIVLIRVKKVENFHSILEKFIIGKRKGSLHLRAMAGLAGLVQYTPQTPEWNTSLNVLINVLCDREYPLIQREFLVELLMYVDDDITDLILTSILELPKDLQNVANQGFNRLVKIFSQKELSQGSISQF